MKLSLARIALVTFIVLAAGQEANAQFVHGITRPLYSTNNPDVYLTDVNTGVSTFLLDTLSIPATAPGFGGLAADEPNARLFGSVRNSTDDLYSIDYATLTPTFLAKIKRPGVTTGMAIDGLAYDSTRGTLYATRVLGGSTGAEALFVINPLTGDSTVFLEYEPTSTSLYSIPAIDYDPVTDRIYLIDEDDTGGRNIYSVDPAATTPSLVFVTTLPSPITDVDGLGAGNGKLFLVSDGPDIPGTTPIEGNGGNHYVYDILTDTFSVLGPTPYPQYTLSTQLGYINPSAGGAYAPGLIPEPAALTLLAIGSLLVLRRR